MIKGKDGETSRAGNNKEPVPALTLSGEGRAVIREARESWSHRRKPPDRTCGFQ